MKMKSLLSGLAVLALSVSSAAAHCGSCGVGEKAAGHDHGSAAAGKKAGNGAAKQAKDRLLKEGAYSAKVKAIVCGGCGEYIQKTMEKSPGIEAVSVDAGAATVNFAVKKGQQVKLSELQKALKASADSMGMGADYTLSDIKGL